MDPLICSKCRSKSCNVTTEGCVDVCEWGVAFHNDDGKIIKKEALVPLRYLSQNLRHELNRFLSLIVKDANQIDSGITSKYIDVNNPASRILHTTTIIDKFIQMVAGVNEFHPSFQKRHNITKRVSLNKTIKKYFDIYSLIRNPRRAKNIELRMIDTDKIYIDFAADLIENLISLLIDNVWKYSNENTIVEIITRKNTENTISISFKNESKPLPYEVNIFEKGSQANSDSEGFGYGLFWAEVVIDYYNELLGNDQHKSKILHKEHIISPDIAIQEFTLKNILAS